MKERTAHAGLTLSRLVYYSPEENDRNAMLHIYNKESGKTVALINLPDILQQGRDAYAAQNYGIQEYLDREYDYRLDFFLIGTEWQYLNLSVGVLDWAKRIQRISL